MENHFFVGGNQEVYLRIPKEPNDEQITITLTFSRELIGEYLKLQVLPTNTDEIPIRSNCKEDECRDCGVVYCPVHYGNAQLIDVCEDKVKADDRQIILGHPNCHYGECWECHVVSCAIQQSGEIPLNNKV